MYYTNQDHRKSCPLRAKNIVCVCIVHVATLFGRQWATEMKCAWEIRERRTGAHTVRFLLLCSSSLHPFVLCIYALYICVTPHYPTDCACGFFSSATLCVYACTFVRTCVCSWKRGGWRFGSHSHSHRHFDGLKPHRKRREIRREKEWLKGRSAKGQVVSDRKQLIAIIPTRVPQFAFKPHRCRRARSSQQSIYLFASWSQFGTAISWCQNRTGTQSRRSIQSNWHPCPISTQLSLAREHWRRIALPKLRPVITVPLCRSVPLPLALAHESRKW